jgi:hypothetical protein
MEKDKKKELEEDWMGSFQTHPCDFAQFVHLKGPRQVVDSHWQSHGSASERTLEVPDSFAETGSRATHQSEARMPVQPVARQLVKTQQTERLSACCSEL